MKRLWVSAFILLATATLTGGCAPDVGTDASLYNEGVNASSSHYDDVEFVTARELGYRPPQGRYCTQEFAIMYNFRHSLCFRATDGCQIDFAFDLGFVYDDHGFCD